MIRQNIYSPGLILKRANTGPSKLFPPRRKSSAKGELTRSFASSNPANTVFFRIAKHTDKILSHGFKLLVYRSVIQFCREIPSGRLLVVFPATR